MFAFVLRKCQSTKCELSIVKTFDIAQYLRLDNRRALVTIDREEIRERVVTRTQCITWNVLVGAFKAAQGRNWWR